MILIISHEDDLHAQSVIDELRRCGQKHHLLNLSDFPRSESLSLHFGDPGWAAQWSQKDGSGIDLTAFRSAWWRRPQPFDFDESLENRYYAAAECDEAVTGLWYAMAAKWINAPLLDYGAHKKVYQMRCAQELGLKMPETLITNSPEDALRFVEAHDRVIYKPFGPDAQEWRETRIFGDEERQHIASLRHAPVIFQKFIPGLDYRVTVVGDKVFAASVDARDAAYPIDFRMNIENTDIRATQLPDDVAGPLLALVKRLGLVYGAADFRRDDHTGEFHFLEVNPAGQWLFVEVETGQPIAAAMAEELAAA